MILYISATGISPLKLAEEASEDKIYSSVVMVVLSESYGAVSRLVVRCGRYE